jgi:hypothetical protein
MASYLDCTPANLPAVKADFCAPDISFGQIKDLYVGYPNQPFDDVSDLNEWTTRLSNTTLADLTKVRSFFVIGSMPAAESNVIAFSQGRETETPLSHQIPFRVDETDSVNFAFLQFAQANPQRVYAIWFSSGKYLFGGDSGVFANIRMKYVIPESDEELHYFECIATWKGETPARITNPMAA